METYNLGRDTVRKAVSILVQEGYLIKRRGKGTFVANTSFSIGFEPLISLRHSLRVRGLVETNVILHQENTHLPQAWSTPTRISLEDQVMRIIRLRTVEGRPLAVEESIFSIENLDLDQMDPIQSISSFLLGQWKGRIAKIEQVMVPRLPSKAECEALTIGRDDQVLELRRWIYIEKIETAVSYVSFVIPLHEYDFSI
jgi:DNA-binding GntR family transcriptional regulator